MLGECIKKMKAEARGYFRWIWQKWFGVNEMTIVNWEKGKTKPAKEYSQIMSSSISHHSCPN